MGIHLSTLEENCCEYLNSLDTVNLDKYKSDKTMSSVDRVLECDDKYIFIEEKSFVLDYFRLAGKKAKCNLIPKDNIIEDEFIDKITELDKDIKKQLLYKAISDKLLSSSDKIKDTVFMLCKDENFCDDKIKNSNTIYLYCSGGEPLNRFFNLVFNSKKHKNKIIECNDLEKYLKIKGCN